MGERQEKLLGRVRNEMLIYGSGGFTSYTKEQLQQQLGGWAEEGIRYLIGLNGGKNLITPTALAAE